jgi:predicted ArsR family transcriptional regulator
MLAAYGYEPRVQGDRMLLANCPFHTLSREHTALVCGMNLHLITAMLDELGHPDVEARLDPAPDRCCVTLTAELV